MFNKVIHIARSILISPIELVRSKEPVEFLISLLATGILILIIVASVIIRFLCGAPGSGLVIFPIILLLTSLGLSFWLDGDR